MTATARGDHQGAAERAAPDEAGDVVAGAVRAASALARAELEVLLCEHRPAARRALVDGGLGAAGAAAGAVALGALAWALGSGLAEAMPVWAAALLVAGVCVAVGLAAGVALVRRHRAGRLLAIMSAVSPYERERRLAEALTARARAERMVRQVASEAVEALTARMAEHGVAAALAVAEGGAGRVAHVVEEGVEDTAEAALHGAERVAERAAEEVEELLALDEAGGGNPAGGSGGGREPRTLTTLARVVTAPGRFAVGVLAAAVSGGERAREGRARERGGGPAGRPAGPQPPPEKPPGTLAGG